MTPFDFRNYKEIILRDLGDEKLQKYKSKENLNLHYSDLLDPSSLNQLIQKTQPDEVYKLAAQSHVAVSFKNPVFSGVLFSCSII